MSSSTSIDVELKPINIKKVYPLASELCAVNTDIKCTEEGCSGTFTSESNLTLHLAKTHKKQCLVKNDEDCVLHHHCPEVSCIYNNVKHFKKMKYLKQHYLKVHADKSFICEMCSKGFPTLATKHTHTELCGMDFKCLECSNTYKSYESLLTHGRRKKHRIPKLTKKVLKKKLCKSTSETRSNVKNISILPKQSTSMQTIGMIPIYIQVKEPIISINKEIQTEPCTNLKTKLRSLKRRSTIYTQTCPRKKFRRSTETQTTGDCILKKAFQECKVNLEENALQKSTKCMETQTKTLNWLENEKMTGENNSTQTIVFDLENKPSDLSLETLSSENMTSSSQTSMNSLNNFFEDCSFGNCQETQTDIFCQDDFLQSSYISHIETQTNDDMDLCSNMYTQTCNDQLLSDFGFSNIQTQTTWPDYDIYVSTETQTLPTQNTKLIFDMPMSVREISHMETQTDMEFKQLLEEINA